MLLLICLPFLLAEQAEKPIQGWLGVVVEEMSPAMLAALGIEHGVLVTEVVKDGPGAKAGLKMGDVILEIGGKRVKSIRDLRRLVRSRAGEKVAVTFFRRQKRHQIMVELERRRRRGFEPFDLKPPSTELGRSLRETWEKLLPQWRRSMEIYKHMLDSLQEQLEETKRELKELQRRQEEENR